MPAVVVQRTDSAYVIQVEVPYQDSMLVALNEAGVAATEEALRRFDADGRPIRLGPMTLTSMGKVHKEYQTPYGVAAIERHVYQGSKVARPTVRSIRMHESSSVRPRGSPA